MASQSHGRGRGQRGHAAVEVALMMPWIFFLFVAVLDFGFYAYASICVQNAARVAALATGWNPASAGSQTMACIYAREDMKYLPNAGSFSAACDALPLIVTVAQPGQLGGVDRSRVSLTYQTVPMIPFPGVLPGQFTLTRIVDAPVFGE